MDWARAVKLRELAVQILPGVLMLYKDGEKVSDTFFVCRSLQLAQELMDQTTEPIDVPTTDELDKEELDDGKE